MFADSNIADLIVNLQSVDSTDTSEGKVRAMREIEQQENPEIQKSKES